VLIKDICDQIKRDIELPDYIEKLGYPIIKGGHKIKILCPFKDHSEKTPSFQVSHDSDCWLFYCFGCKRGGTIIDFYKEYHGVSIGRAIKDLSKNSNILGDLDYLESLIDDFYKKDDVIKQDYTEINQINGYVSLAMRNHLYNNPQDLDIIMKLSKEFDNNIMIPRDIESAREWKDNIVKLLKKRAENNAAKN